MNRAIATQDSFMRSCGADGPAGPNFPSRSPFIHPRVNSGSTIGPRCASDLPEAVLIREPWSTFSHTGIYRTVVTECGSQRAPFETEWFEMAIRNEMQVPDTGPMPGFDRYSRVVRERCLRKMFIKDTQETRGFCFESCRPTSPGRGRAVGRNILGQCFPGVFCSVVVMFRVISPGLAHMLF